MFKRHLTIAIRHLWKQKWVNLLHIAGLSIGMASTLLLFFFVRFEYSYDRSFQAADRVFKLIETRTQPEDTYKTALTPYTFARAITEELPEVEISTAVSGPYKGMQVSVPDVSGPDVHFLEDNILLADSNFLKVFDLKIISGTRTGSLDSPNEVVLTASTAKRLFGEKDPVGQALMVSNKPSVVTAVCEDVPANSHLQFNYLVSASSVAWLSQSEMNLRVAHCYLRLRDQDQAEVLEANFPALVKRYLSSTIAKAHGQNWEDYLAAGNAIAYHLQALPELYLHPDDLGWMKAGGNRQLLWILVVVAILILLLAISNFVNLSLSQAHERFKEVGIRKVIGAQRTQIMLQLMMEASLLVVLSTVVSVGLLFFSFPFFEALVDKPFMSVEWSVWALIIPLLIIGCTLFTTLIPSWIISAFSTLHLLRGTFSPTFKTHWAKWAISGFQSWISLALIMVSVIVYQQFRFLSNKNLGYDQDQVLVIEGTFSRDPAMTQPFLQSLRQMSEVELASGTLWVPAYGNNWRDLYQVQNQPNTHEIDRVMIGDYFCELMEIQLLEGQLFSPESVDSNYVLINEKTKELFGLENAVGQRLMINSKDANEAQQTFIIKGVIENFHYHSLRHDLAPLVLQSNEIHGRMRYILAKIKGQHLQESIAKIKRSWHEMVPDRPFVFSFLDAKIQAKYQAEQSLSKLVFLFSILAISIACLGFLAIFSNHLRQKAQEISIRRIIGADFYQLFYYLSRHFFWTFGISFLLAVPVAILFRQQWISHYAYYHSLDAWPFLLALSLLGILLLAIVVYRTLRSLSDSPVRHLKV